MYKLIIVDDEYTIRKGLKQYIPWDTIGFEVVGVFEDGLSAIGFLSQNPVDVVLTDIDMPIMNGIQLIESIRSNNYASYCVVISGYQDFNYARQLIPFRITDYILKPINNELVQSTFLKLKQELDENLEKEKQVTQEHAHMKLMQDTLLQQCLSDMILERISYPQALKHMENLDLGIDLLSAQIIYAELKITNLNQLLRETWHYGIDALYDSITNFLKNCIKHRLFDFIKSQDTLCLVYVDGTGKDINELISTFQKDLKRASENIRELSSIELDILSVRNYKTPDPSVTPQQKICTTTPQTDVNTNNNVDFSHFFTAINSALLDHDFDAVNERLEALMLKASSLNKKQALNLYEKLLDILFNQSYEGKEIPQLYKFQLKSCTTVSEYHAVILDCIKKMKSGIISSSNHQIDALMDQALDYIEKNYRKDISRNDVADYVFLSASYFSRCFKQRTNMKFIDYLTKIRIQKACELLLDPANKINDVCFAVGYNSPSYFTRVFKYFIGTTPNDYIRSKVCTKEKK